MSLRIKRRLDSIRRVISRQGENESLYSHSVDSEPFTQLGSMGSGLGQFIYPHDISLDGDGNFVVSDHHNHRVQIFDVYGKVLQSFGKQGESKGEFKGPIGITVDSLGNILVSDCYNSRVQIFYPDGTYNEEAEGMWYWSKRMFRPRFIRYSPLTKSIYMTGGNTVMVFDENWNTKAFKSFDHTQLFGVSGDSKNRTIVCNTNGIHFIDHRMDSVNSIAVLQLTSPYGLTVDKNDNVIVCDRDANQILVYDQDGTKCHTFSDIHHPLGVIYTDDNRLIYTQPHQICAMSNYPLYNQKLS